MTKTVAGSLCRLVALSACHLVMVSSAAAEDVQDVLFLGDGRPVLIRLHVTVDGRPFAARWGDYLARWFRFLDRDGGGTLDEEEAARAPGGRVLQQLFANPYTYQPSAPPPFELLDRDGDKKVSLHEFLRYYRSSEAGPVQLAPAFNQYVQGVRQDQVTERLFGLLDADGDGRLSRAELDAAGEALRKLDQDEDELITLPELLAGGAPPANPPLVPAMQVPAVPLMLVPPADSPRRLGPRLQVAREVLAHYDKNGNKALGRDEIDVPKEQFDQLDANKDGGLDVFELLRLVLPAPGAEVVLRLGHVGGPAKPIEPAGRSPALRRAAERVVEFTADDYCVNLIAAPGVPPQPAGSVRQVLVQQFKTLDAKGTGYLTRNQLRSPQFTYLNNILRLADRDGDDRLSLVELNAGVDLTTGGTGCQVSVALAASGRGLLPILDVNQDGRLSLRELHNARARLAPYDRDRDGHVSRTELPRQYRVVVNPGVPNYFAGQPGGTAGPVPATSAAQPGRGPVWFQKMDRNGDGDVSPREFLGPRAEFRRLDADGDGLISLEEAIRADAALRKK